MIHSVTFSVLVSSRRSANRVTATSVPVNRMPTSQQPTLTTAVTAQLAFLTTGSSASTAQATRATVPRQVQALYLNGTRTVPRIALAAHLQNHLTRARRTKRSRMIPTRSQVSRTPTTPTQLQTQTTPSCQISTPTTTTLVFSIWATPIPRTTCHNWTLSILFFSETTETPVKTTCSVLTSTMTSSMMLLPNLAQSTTHPPVIFSAYFKTFHSPVSQLRLQLHPVAISWPRWTRPGMVATTTMVCPHLFSRILLNLNSRRPPSRRTARASSSAATTFGMLSTCPSGFFHLNPN